MTVKEYWKDKRVLITEGTSGLGKALGLTLDNYGAHIVIIARNQEAAEALVEGRNIHFIQGDVAAKHDIHRLAGETLGILGGIDVFFNNASYLGKTPLTLLMDTECEDLEKALTTNVVGPFRLTKALLPSMILQNQGVVINISSDAAVNAYSKWGSYSVSKAALDHLSRVWSQELTSLGPRFLAIDPGDMNTAMHFSAIPDADSSKLYDPTEVARDLLAFISREQNSLHVRYTSQDWRTLIK